MSNVTGTTVIDHSIRKDLKLSCSSYVVMDFLYNWKNNPNKRSELFTSKDLWKAIGVFDIGVELLHLRDKGLIGIDLKTMKYSISDKWKNHFNVDDKFIILWEIFEKKGNRQTALNRYKVVVKKTPHEELVRAATKYMKYQETIKSERQFRKGLDVWLNPQKRHWEDIVELPHEAEKPNIFKGEFFQ